MTRAFLTVLLLTSTVVHGAAPSDEDIVRQLDDAERIAILHEDLPALTTLMAEDIVVNNPQNGVSIDRDAVIARIKNGLVRYRTFERIVDHVHVNGDVAFVVGIEAVVPKRDGEPETIHRRFMNVWKRTGETWHLVARQATIIARN